MNLGTVKRISGVPPSEGEQEGGEIPSLRIAGSRELPHRWVPERERREAPLFAGAGKPGQGIDLLTLENQMDPC